MRILGVDPGVRRIGLALSDPDGVIASPIATLQPSSSAHAATLIAAEAERLEVGKIVLGLPLRMDGGEGDAARSSRRLAERLRELTGLPVVLWDERLTSVTAARALRETGRGRARRKQLIDQAAAAVLLQSYLDAEQERDGAPR